jgi:hypothetical protein
MVSSNVILHTSGFVNINHSLSEITSNDVTDAEAGVISPLGPRRDSPSSIAKPIRPVEFSLWVAFPFINLFILLAVVLGVVYGKAHTNGKFENIHSLVPTWSPDT